MSKIHWVYSVYHRQLFQVIESYTFWGEMTYRVWLSVRVSVSHITASKLTSIQYYGVDTPEYIVYFTSSVWEADNLTHDVLLLPIKSSFIPLLNKIRALSHDVANNRIYYLLTEEVSLDKNIKAGIIKRGQERSDYSCAARSKINERVVLLQVRNHRLTMLHQEKKHEKKSLSTT